MTEDEDINEYIRKEWEDDAPFHPWVGQITQEHTDDGF